MWKCALIPLIARHSTPPAPGSPRRVGTKSAKNSARAHVCRGQRGKHVAIGSGDFADPMSAAKRFAGVRMF